MAPHAAPRVAPDRHPPHTAKERPARRRQHSLPPAASPAGIYFRFLSYARVPALCIQPLSQLQPASRRGPRGGAWAPGHRSRLVGELSREAGSGSGSGAGVGVRGSGGGRGKSPAAAPVVSEGAGGGPGPSPARSGCCSARLSPRQRLDSAASGCKMAAAGGGSSVNPFLSDSEEDEPEEARPGGGGGSSSSTEPGGPAYPARRREEVAAVGSPEELPGLRAAGDAAAGAGGGAAAGEPPRVSMDAMAAQLLRDQFLLTALELHTELLESGRELPRLRDFFSNPGNFERQSGTPPAGGGLGGSVLGGAGGREPGSGQLSKCLPLAGARAAGLGAGLCWT